MGRREPDPVSARQRGVWRADPQVLSLGTRARTAVLPWPYPKGPRSHDQPRPVRRRQPRISRGRGPRAPGPRKDRPAQRLVLAVLLTASFTLAVDFSILNVALPRIGADVGFSLANLQWIATRSRCARPASPCSSGGSPTCSGGAGMFLVGIAVLGVGSLAAVWPRRPGSCRCAGRAGARDGGGHSGGTVVVDDVVPGGPDPRQGARPERRPDGGRIHHRGDPRWCPHRPA